MVVDNGSALENRKFIWRLDQNNNLLLVSAHQRYYSSVASGGKQRMEAFWDDEDHALMVGRDGRNYMFEDAKFRFQLEDLDAE